RALWDEFEHGSSPEARFARSLDRFAGFLLNHASGGRSWRDNGVTADMIHARNERIGDGAPALWDEVRRRLAAAVAAGLVDPGPRDGGGSWPPPPARAARSDGEDGGCAAGTRSSLRPSDSSVSNGRLYPRARWWMP